MKRFLKWEIFLSMLLGMCLAVMTAPASTLINLTYQVTGILPHGNGGTDISSPGSSGNVLTSNGTNWTSAAPAGTVTGTGTSPKIAVWATTSSLGNIGTPSLCSTGYSAAGIDVNGNATSCLAVGGSAAGFVWGGDGSDGSVNMDGTNTYTNFASTTGSPPNLVYTLIRDVFATDFTLASSKSLFTANYIVYGFTSITVNGTIDNSGLTGTTTTAGSDANGSNAGSLPLPMLSVSHCHGNGGAGGAGGTTNGTQGGVAVGGTAVTTSAFQTAYAPSSWNSGAGGNVGANTGGGARANAAAGAFTTLKCKPHVVSRAFGYAFCGTSAINFIFAAYEGLNGVGGGGGGGGGAGDGTNAGATGGTGGGGGGCGGFIVLSSPTITVGASGVVQSNGAIGNSGVKGNDAAVGGNRGGGGGGAGGPGGHGGIICLVYHAYTNSGTVQALAGAAGPHGAGGAHTGTGNDGNNGQDGAAGTAGLVLTFAQ